jgi:hypothetical protein
MKVYNSLTLLYELMRLMAQNTFTRQQHSIVEARLGNRIVGIMFVSLLRTAALGLLCDLS